MTKETLSVAVAKLHERLIALDTKAVAASSSAHTRIDKLEVLVQEEIREFRADVKDLAKEVKEISQWMHRGRGWAAAGMLFLGLVGGSIASLIVGVFKH